MTHAPTFAFGPYLFAPTRQLLLKKGLPVRIGCRALDLLAAFVQRPGEMLSKRELMEEAWPSTTVVEGNLKVHIAALRRALGDDAEASSYIATVNGRGYRFISSVEVGDASSLMPCAIKPSAPAREVVQDCVAPAEHRFRDIVAQLARAMRSVVIDLPVDPELGALPETPRRVLCIELAPRDEAWIEHVFAQSRRISSATH